MTITFETEIKNGKIIIPKELRRRLKDEVTVSVKVKKSEKRAEESYDIISELMKNPLKVDKSIPFLTRDELHNRKL